MWPFSTIKHLRKRNAELNGKNRALTRKRDELWKDLNAARDRCKKYDEQVLELTAQIKDFALTRKHTRDGIAAYIDCAKNGSSFGRIVVAREKRPVKDETLVLQPLAGRRKQSVDDAKGWARKILRTFDIEPKGMDCLVERRSKDGKINVTEEVL